jgi:DNA-binding Lrp family transcriptional regulator
MDSLMTTRQLAERLGTSVPRMHRAVKAGVIAPASRGARGRLLFDQIAEDTLRARWGITPPVAGLTRSEALVLAALARWPFGLRSARAVARQAGLSPTVAARVLTRLRERGLVRQRHLLVAEGHAREVENWSIEWRSPEWWRLAAAVDRIYPPTFAGTRKAIPRQPRRVPRRFWHLFWDVNPESIDLRRHADYVVARVLEFGDRNALAWLVVALPAEAFRSVARKSDRLPPEVRRLADVLARGLS